jgi:hypothetical protein
LLTAAFLISFPGAQLRVELPSKRPDGTSNNWVEMRDRIRPLDRPAIQEAGFKVTIETRPDGTEVRHATGGGLAYMQFALLARVITAWSFDGVPIPSQNIAKPEDVLDSVLDEDDWDTACEAIQPMLDRILQGRPKTETTTEE